MNDETRMTNEAPPPQVKEHPILFSGEMVRALLAGRKTQTRRVMKPQPTAIHGQGGNYTASYQPDGDGRKSLNCPYGQPGDRLWVRETFRVWRDEDSLLAGRIADRSELLTRTEYRATSGDALSNGWRPSIHMPRWASRLTLEITGVRVERLQDIGEADAVAEGVESRFVHDDPAYPEDGADYWKDYTLDNEFGFLRASDSYRSLWESINGPGSWELNPWVWVVEFKVLEGGPNA